jgi:hypothetical protein
MIRLSHRLTDVGLTVLGLPIVGLLVVIALAAPPAFAREPRMTRSSGQPVESHEALAAEAAGLAEVRYIPNDSRSAQILIANRADRPLSIRLPAAFVGVPVLAQMGMGGGGGAGFGAGGIGGGAQMTGGGMGGMGMGGGMGGMGGGMGGGGFCWVAREVYGPHDPRWLAFRGWLSTDAPAWLQAAYGTHGEWFADWLHDKPAAKWAVRQALDACLASADETFTEVAHLQVEQTTGGFLVPPGKTRTIRFATVCLEHGKPEPSPRIPYRLQPLDSVSQDPRLEFVLMALANGRVSQRVAQAAAWHVANGLSWERLAAETIRHAGGVPDEPFFQRAELVSAMQLVAAADREAANRSPEATTGTSAGVR